MGKNMTNDTIILSDVEIKTRLRDFPGWKYEYKKIVKNFRFKDFVDAYDFLGQIIPFCEQIDHHPDACVSYGRIRFELSRHDAGGRVSNLDFMVAGEIESRYRQGRSPQPPIN